MQLALHPSLAVDILWLSSYCYCVINCLQLFNSQRIKNVVFCHRSHGTLTSNAECLVHEIKTI